MKIDQAGAQQGVVEASWMAALKSARLLSIDADYAKPS